MGVAAEPHARMAGGNRTRCTAPLTRDLKVLESSRRRGFGYISACALASARQARVFIPQNREHNKSAVVLPRSPPRRAQIGLKPPETRYKS